MDYGRKDNLPLTFQFSIVEGKHIIRTIQKVVTHIYIGVWCVSFLRNWGVKTISKNQKQCATWLGAILLVVGLLGFAIGDMVLWFSVNNTHTWVHLLSGIIGLLAGLSAKGAYAGTYNKVFGVVYLLIAVLGFLSIGGIVEWLALNPADNWLHLIIGAVAAWVGFKA